MTTVAWKDGVLAADRKGSQGGTAYRVTKLFKTKTHAIAVSGYIGYGRLFLEWFTGDRTNMCPLEDGCDTCVFVMDLATGKCESWESPGVGIPVEDRFAAIGSGQDLAVGAMSFGASAIEAVKCASVWDNSTGLGVSYAKAKTAT